MIAPFHISDISESFSSYYVATIHSSVQVDGYMHKSKSCCQKVADAFNADVIRVKPNQSAGKNSYGQTVKYKDCFSYCPLCCDWWVITYSAEMNIKKRLA